MATSKDKFTFKIILSYLVLGALFFLVGIFLYSEFERLTSESDKSIGDKKYIETGTLINLVYEADGFSRLALLTENDSDYEKYTSKTDSLFLKLKEINSLLTNDFQLKQLDSVKSLLIEKNQNIEQLRILALTNKKDTSLDDIMVQVRKLEASVGLNSVESMVKNPSKLSSRERKVWQSYADYLNRDSRRDTSRIRSKAVDSMLIASRYIVAEAKKENSRISQSLRQKENELILNDLKISERLRGIVASFDAEITKNNNLENELRTASIYRTGQILKFTGILGGAVILIFSYFILSDFFKAERFKRNLEESKNYAETLLKSREQLISTVSHDLKTPLNTINGYSELFETSNLSEKQKYYLTQITSSSNFISHLVDDLLDYSKLEVGKLSVETVPFSLENIILDAANAIDQVDSLTSVALKIDIPESIKGVIFESDPLRIRQILNNLIGNAFKFTDKGSVHIQVKELKSNEQKSTIEISVIDTGIGISKEKQEDIFNEFTQAEADIAHKFGGSGLGLAISKKLTQLLDGTLKVDSNLGSGSRFTLTLPLKKSNRILSTSSPNKKSLLKGLKAVIIDDDQMMRSLLKEILQQIEIETEIFDSFDGFRAFANNPNGQLEFDFLITDIQMPKTDGFNVLKNLQHGDVTSYINQPVIAMTGSREHARDFFFEKGFSGILRKPFSKDNLINVLTQIFQNPISLEEQDSDIILEKTLIHEDKFDLDLLKSFLNTPEALTEVLDVFNSQTEKDLKNIKVALSENDLEAIRQISHRMLTMFRQLQAGRIIPILQKMEAYSTENSDISKMKMDYEKLILNVRDLQKALGYR